VSFALDVNVLLYASNAAAPEHEAATAFLKRCTTGRDVFCLGWPTLMSYLRIATHPSIFPRPLSHAHAVENIESLVRLPQVRLLSETEAFWETYCEVTGSVPTRGNMVPDAHLASLLRVHGVRTLFTNDRDYRKFDFLDVRSFLE
jgi:uncharacterized protein